MSTTPKHTPEPWEYEKREDRDCAFVVVASASDNRDVIAEVDTDDITEDLGQSAEANARLIAAAPELLAVVERFAKWSCCRTDGHCSMLPVEPCDPCAARAALAKVTP